MIAQLYILAIEVQQPKQYKLNYMPKKPPKKTVSTNGFLAIGITFMTIGITLSIIQDQTIGASLFVPGIVFLVLGIKRN